MTREQNRIDTRLAQLNVKERDVRSGKILPPKDWRARRFEEGLSWLVMIFKGMATDDSSTETAMAETRRSLWLRQELGAIEMERGALNAQRPSIDDSGRTTYPGGAEALQADFTRATTRLRRAGHKVTNQAVATELGIDRGTLAMHIKRGRIKTTG